MRNFVIVLLLLCLITGFGCHGSETGRSSERHTPTPAPGQQPNTSSTPLKENSNRQEKTAPATTAPPAETNKVAESSSSSPSPIEQKKGSCDPNYSGCVPIASDVDCASGNGDGPEYVDGPIEVIGVDKYKLDKDGDGIACEN